MLSRYLYYLSDTICILFNLKLISNYYYLIFYINLEKQSKYTNIDNPILFQIFYGVYLDHEIQYFVGVFYYF